MTNTTEFSNITATVDNKGAKFAFMSFPLEGENKVAIVPFAVATGFGLDSPVQLEIDGEYEVNCTQAEDGKFTVTTIVKQLKAGKKSPPKAAAKTETAPKPKAQKAKGDKSKAKAKKPQPKKAKVQKPKLPQLPVGARGTGVLKALDGGENFLHDKGFGFVQAVCVDADGEFADAFIHISKIPADLQEAIFRGEEFMFRMIEGRKEGEVCADIMQMYEAEAPAAEEEAEAAAA